MNGIKKNKWLVIVNPNAGAGNCKKDWPGIKELLETKNFDYEAVFTRKRFHAIIISRQKIREGFRKVIVVGGDGTLNEVINGLFAQKDFPTTEITLGLIPVGTGNDWARMFGISSEYEKALETIKKGNTFIQDAGRVLFMNKNQKQGRYFINIAGLGFDAVVTKKTNKLKERGKKSRLLYLWSIFAGLFGYKHMKANFTIDGTEYTNDIFSMNIGICRFNGGGMIQIPNAIPDDGKFDLTVIKKMRKLEIIRSLPTLYNGKINKHPKVLTYIGRKILIDSVKTVFIETDGENLGHTPFEFEIIPKSVKVITAI